MGYSRLFYHKPDNQASVCMAFLGVMTLCQAVSILLIHQSVSYLAFSDILIALLNLVL